MKPFIILILWVTVSALGCKTKFETTQHECLGCKFYLQSTPISTENSIVTGRVQNVNGDLIEYANVVIRDNQNKTSHTSTDANGQFSITQLPAGSYYLTISLIGFETFESQLQIEKATKYKLDTSLPESRVGIEKPVIYLYPLKKQAINVVLHYKGELTHTYPKYTESGWKVTADPNGTLWDEKGQEYYALFWEGLPSKPLVPKDGFIVPGKETVAFLEEKLAYLGLNRREANEFIMYWLPQMENNPYNLIHFSGIEYEHLANLTITPQPETVIRVMMLTQPLQSKISFPLQDLTTLKKVRKGYTVVEWGGSTIVNSLPDL